MRWPSPRCGDHGFKKHAIFIFGALGAPEFAGARSSRTDTDHAACVVVVEQLGRVGVKQRYKQCQVSGAGSGAAPQVRVCVCAVAATTLTRDSPAGCASGAARKRARRGHHAGDKPQCVHPSQAWTLLDECGIMLMQPAGAWHGSR